MSVSGGIYTYRRISVIIIPTLFAVAIFAYMLYQIRSDLLTALQRIDPSYIVIAILICCGAWVLRGARYQYILSGLFVAIDTTYATACVLISQTANLVVPARLGDLVRMFILKHEGKATYSQGLSSLVVERVFDVVIVALLGFISIQFVFNVPSWAYTFIMIPLIGGAIFFLLLYILGLVESTNRYIGIVLKVIQEVRQASLNVRSLPFLSLSSIAIWFLDIAVCFIVVTMFRVEISFMVVVLAIAIGNLVKAVPLTPGGLGTYELTLATIFSLSGVPMVIATLIAVIDHLVKNMVTLVGGILSIYYFGNWVVAIMKKALRIKVGEEEPIGD